MRRVFSRAFLLLLALFLTAFLFGDDSELLSQAQKQLEEGQFEQAVASLNAALAQEEATPRLRFLLGRAYYEQRNFNQAVQELERAVKGEMRNPIYHLWLGRAYGRKAERSSWFSAISLAGKTRREFETAVQLDPGNLEARQDLLEFYLEAPGFLGGGRDKARAQAEEIAKRDPGEGHRAWASYWADQKQFDKAETELKKAVEAQPPCGPSAAADGRPSEALRAQEGRPTGGGPCRPEAYYDLAEFYRKRGRFAEMEPVMQMAMERHGKDRRLPYFVAVTYIVNDKRLDEAKQLLEKYLAGPIGAEDPSRAQGRLWLGRLYEKENELSKAEEEYRKAIELDGGLKEAKEALRKVRKKE